jgi:hypothetical protein
VTPNGVGPSRSCVVEFFPEPRDVDSSVAHNKSSVLLSQFLLSVKGEVEAVPAGVTVKISTTNPHFAGSRFRGCNLHLR